MVDHHVAANCPQCSHHFFINDSEVERLLAVKDEAKAELVKKEVDRVMKVVKLEIEKEITQKYLSTIQQLEKSNETKDLKNEIAINKLKESHEIKIRDLENEIRRINDYKQRRSTKAVGEDLEIWVRNQIEPFEKLLPNLVFEKDNNVVEGTKGDYVAREFDHDNVEILSCLIECKTEVDTTKSKKRNEDHYEKLDRDRNKKNATWAFQVSTLEPENEMFNSGMVTVFNKYPNMIVVRPDQFVSAFLTIREFSLQVYDLKKKLENEKLKSIDVTNFRNDLEKMQLASSKYLEQIHNNIEKVITKQTRIIKDAEDTMELLLTSTRRNTRLLNTKIQGISVQKLCKNNETMTRMFEEV